MAPRDPLIKRSIANRIAGGITDHLRSRLTDWCLASALVYSALDIIPSAAAGNNPITAHTLRLLTQVIDPFIWLILAVAVGVARLTALFIDGAFPHIKGVTLARMHLSIITVPFWLNILMGYGTFRPLPTSTAAWAVLLVLEMNNVYSRAIECRINRWKA